MSIWNTWNQIGKNHSFNNNFGTLCICESEFCWSLLLEIFFASPQLPDASVPKKALLVSCQSSSSVALSGQLRPIHCYCHQFAHHTARIHNSLIVIMSFSRWQGWLTWWPSWGRWPRWWGWPPTGRVNTGCGSTNPQRPVPTPPLTNCANCSLHQH